MDKCPYNGYWAIKDSDMFVQVYPDGYIELGDQCGDRNTLTPTELRALYKTLGEVIQFISTLDNPSNGKSVGTIIVRIWDAIGFDPASHILT